MSEAFNKGDVRTTQTIAQKTLDELDTMKQEVSESNTEVNKVLSDIGSEDLNKKQEKYEQKIQEEFSMAESYLNAIKNDENSIKENIEAYSKLFETEESDIVADNSEFNPENVIKADYEELDVKKAKSVSSVPSLSLNESSLSEESLELTGDVAISDEIKAKADELKTPYACLLYPAPSPRDAHESRMPSSA